MMKFMYIDDEDEYRNNLAAINVGGGNDVEEFTGAFAVIRSDNWRMHIDEFVFLHTNKQRFTSNKH